MTKITFRFEPRFYGVLEDTIDLDSLIDYFDMTLEDWHELPKEHKLDYISEYEQDLIYSSLDISTSIKGEV